MWGWQSEPSDCQLVPQRFESMSKQLIILFNLILVSLSTMNGHWFPIFLKFKGGIGLATAIGAIMGLALIPCVISSLPAILALYIFKKPHYSGLAFFASILIFSLICLKGLPECFSLSVRVSR